MWTSREILPKASRSSKSTPWGPCTPATPRPPRPSRPSRPSRPDHAVQPWFGFLLRFPLLPANSGEMDVPAARCKPFIPCYRISNSPNGGPPAECFGCNLPVPGYTDVGLSHCRLSGTPRADPKVTSGPKCHAGIGNDCLMADCFQDAPCACFD